ncbi:uroporphyrinogen-III synthase [Dysgonomonas sp. 520]|uniref:uroporphyrinogen-III synthase n=1 Tax=Dysgonomonas sp. 520 TaxID=2302931 RepID=UPI0013D21F63|nr:uroporphyrinogen-III synthase [Dysgonomonas sp. 520]NDW09163.1 uroporphyrinogen-III synthase [Dysgonomonas sp. 520]
MSVKIKKVLISQPKPATEKSPYFDIAEKYNLTMDFRQFIKVEGLDAKEFRQQRINIQDYTAIVFTAKLAIDHFFSLCEELRITMPESMKYFCISESVALYLQKYIVYRKRKIFFSTTGKMEGLASPLTKHNKEKFLVPVSDVHNDDITAILDEKKVDYTKAIMYRTVSTEIPGEYISSYDMIVFFSPLGIVSLFKNSPDFEQGDIYIGCFGATTAKAIKDAGLRLDCEAPQPGFPSMTAALDAFIKENHKKK